MSRSRHMAGLGLVMQRLVYIPGKDAAQAKKSGTKQPGMYTSLLTKLTNYSLPDLAG